MHGQLTWWDTTKRRWFVVDYMTGMIYDAETQSIVAPVDKYPAIEAALQHLHQVFAMTYIKY